MKNTRFTFNNKPLAILSIGCMRFPSREDAVAVVRKSVENKALYLDTSPAYCYHSEQENTETWVGEAIKGIRDKVILSAKCSTGNGGDDIGDYWPTHGFSITTADQVRKEIEQSLRRLDVDKLDCYQLWAVHSPKIFNEAFKKGGWMEGVQKARDEGLFKHLGITGHGGNEEIRRWVDAGCFEMITVPFNIMDNSRLDGIKYALSKDIAVIAMNPLAGGFLGSPSESIAKEMTEFGIDSAYDMALRYVTSFEGVSALAGMSYESHVLDNIKVLDKKSFTESEAIAIREKFFSMINASEHKCTSCGYCMPCPNEINIPEVLKIRNYANVLQLESAKNDLKNRHNWDKGFKVENCTECSACESKCPNSVNIIELLKEVRSFREDIR